MEGLIGQIIPNAYADLIILDKNPLEDINILDGWSGHLEAVVKGGYVVSSKLRELPVDQI